MWKIWNSCILLVGMCSTSCKMCSMVGPQKLKTKLPFCAVLSRSVVSNYLQPHGLQPTRLLCLWNFPGKNTGVGCHFLLQAIFPTQGSNLGFLHRRQMLYHLSQQGRLRFYMLFDLPIPLRGIHPKGRGIGGLMGKIQAQIIFIRCFRITSNDMKRYCTLK